ncbi:RDD family protein [Streptomyces sp. NPDC005492]|uniref:RDD family protein n=1 Tax=Streptomyces sp. NPDC005492 TaxID=3156883 RepID=UPI00339E5F4F
MSAPTPAPGDDRPREGYYPDPSIPGYVRYWNGTAWVPGTSRPAPSDGLPLAAPVEETGPHFFDEDPAPGPADRPEPAAAWGADRSHQSGFGGDQDRRVSWGAPDPRIPAQQEESPDPGTFTFRRPTPDTPDEGTTTFRRPTPRTPQQGGAPGAQGGGAGDFGAQGSAGAGAGAGGPGGGAGSGAGGFGAGAGSAGSGPGAGGYGSEGQAGSGPVASGLGSEGSARSGPGGFGAQGPVGSGSAGGFSAEGRAGSGAGSGGYGSAGSGAGGFGAGAGSAGSNPGASAGGPGSQGLAGPPSSAGGPGVQGPVGAGSTAAGPGSQGAGGNTPVGDPSAPGFGAGKAAAARAAAAQAGPGTGSGAAPAGPANGSAAARAAAAQAGPGGPGAPASAAPVVPQQAGQVQPQGMPMATGPGGGQPSWAQQVHRLAGDEDGVVAPWKPPVEDVFQAAARRQAAARPAGLGKRLVARLVDTLVLGAVTAGAALPLGTRAADHINEKIDAAKLSGRTETVWLLDGTTAVYLGIVLAVFLLVGVLYEALPTAKWGRTLGKKLYGIEVRDIESHEPPGFGGALRRWLVYSVPGLLGIGIVGVAWCLFDRPWHQCWHDKAAHTFVAA